MRLILALSLSIAGFGLAATDDPAPQAVETQPDEPAADRDGSAVERR
jgi:hypothetical protein